MTTTTTTTTTTTRGVRRGRSRGGGAAAFLVFFLGVTLLASPLPSISSTVGIIDEIDGSGGSTPRRYLDELGGESDIDSISSLSSSSFSSSSSSFEEHSTTKAGAKSNEHSVDVGKIKTSLSIEEEDANYLSANHGIDAPLEEVNGFVALSILRCVTMWVLAQPGIVTLRRIVCF